MAEITSGIEGVQGRRFTIAGFASADAACIAEAISVRGGYSRVLPPSVLPCWTEDNQTNALIVHCSLATSLYSRATKSDTALRDPFWKFNGPVIVVGEFDRCVTQSGFLRVFPDGDVLTMVDCLAVWAAEFDRHIMSLSSTDILPATKYRVLVADDDMSMQTLVAHVLNRSVIECHQTKDGRQAIGLAKVIMPDLLILDVNMPGLNGFKVLSEIRSDPGTRAAMVMLLTGRNSATDITMANKLGADMYVVKPIKVYEFRTRVEGLLWKNRSCSMSR